MKIDIPPLDEKTARVLAERRGVTLDIFFSNLIREEAAIEITNWRAPAKSDTTTPISTSTAQPAGVQHVR